MKISTILAALIASVASCSSGSAATFSSASPEKGGATLMRLHSNPTPNPTPKQAVWLQASVQERILMAEELGMVGGRRVARNMGLIPVLEEGMKTVPQGLDGIYRDVNGKMHVFENKGGSGQLGHAYGHAQGSSEWAVKSAERILKSQSATAFEKEAARQVLDAAARGNLEVHVVRTQHVLGEPTKAFIEQSVVCSKHASEIARASLEDIVRPGAKLGQEAVHATSVSERRIASEIVNEIKTASKIEAAAIVATDVSRSAVVKALSKAEETATNTTKALGKAAGKVAKVAGPIALPVEIWVRAEDAIETEQKFRRGAATSEEREISHGRNVGGMTGGIAGASGGAAAGAALGAPFGGVGAVPGAVIGGVLGAIFGGLGGDALGSQIGGTIGKWHARR